MTSCKELNLLNNIKQRGINVSVEYKNLLDLDLNDRFKLINYSEIF